MQASGVRIRNAFALACLLCFIAVFFLTAIYIALHSDHGCIEGICLTCVGIHNAVKLLVHSGNAAVILSLLAGLLFAASAASRPVLFRMPRASLIGAKIRMNN